jgi:hypothetical protein
MSTASFFDVSDASRDYNYAQRCSPRQQRRPPLILHYVTRSGGPSGPQRFYDSVFLPDHLVEVNPTLPVIVRLTVLEWLDRPA